VRAEGNGRLLTFALTPGQQQGITMAETLLEQGSVLRKSTGANAGIRNAWWRIKGTAVVSSVHICENMALQSLSRTRTMIDIKESLTRKWIELAIGLSGFSPD
jgi:hypothetical protein